MNTIVLAALCMAVMLFMNLKRGKKYNVSFRKAITLSVAMGVMGMIGTYILYFIENGGWGGQSFFGAMLFYPLLLYPVAILARMRLTRLLDYATPPGMAMLGLFKLNCSLVGCCGGVVLYHTTTGIPVFFPSQIVEMVIAFLMMSMLVYFEYKGKYDGALYAVTLIVYGASRFAINFLRWKQDEFLFGLPPGNIWSIVSIFIGIILFAIKKLKKVA